MAYVKICEANKYDFVTHIESTNKAHIVCVYYCEKKAKLLFFFLFPLNKIHFYTFITTKKLH